MLLLAVVGCGAPAPPPPHPAWQAQVIGVTDGDTLRVRRDGQNTNVRLHGIDAPERAQPFGERAKQFASAFAFGRSASLEPITVDRYSRLVARVFVDGRCLNEELVAQGLAWHYRRYSSSATLEALELEAREARRGLWSAPDPVPPWDWRRQHPRAGRQPAAQRGGESSVGANAKALSEEPKVARGGALVGNARSRVFHQPDCPAASCKHCTARFESAQQAIDAGYRPHGACDPQRAR